MASVLQESVGEMRFATSAAVALALGQLSSADLSRLEQIARVRASGLTQMSWQDLLHEAIARSLEGARRWPTDIPFLAFMAQTIRSLASDSRRKAIEMSLDDPSILSEGAKVDPAHQAFEDVETLAAIQRHFAQDVDVLTLIDGLLQGETAIETQARTARSLQSYDAARKRFRRGIAKLIGDL